MVYSEELGYDPEEWEECPEPDHFLAFSFSTRVCLSIVTLLLSALLFWILELNKKQSTTPEEKERKLSMRIVEEEEQRSTAEERFARVAEECSYKANARRRSSKRPLTAEEEIKLQEWEAQVKKTEDERLHVSEDTLVIEIQTGELAKDAIEVSSTFGLPPSAFDNQSPLLDFDHSKGSDNKVQFACKTPPSTPRQSLSLVDGAAQYQYKKFAIELEDKLLTELSEIENLENIDAKKLTKQLEEKHKKTIDEHIIALQKTGSSADSDTLKKHFTDKIATVVVQEIERKMSSTNLLIPTTDEDVRQTQTADISLKDQRIVTEKNGSTSSSDEDFVKIRAHKDSHILATQSAKYDFKNRGFFSDLEGQEEVRISLFSNGDTTTADDIEFLQDGRQSTSGFRSKPLTYDDRANLMGENIIGQDRSPTQTGEDAQKILEEYEVPSAPSSLQKIMSSPESPAFGFDIVNFPEVQKEIAVGAEFNVDLGMHSEIKTTIPPSPKSKNAKLSLMALQDENFGKADETLVDRSWLRRESEQILREAIKLATNKQVDEGNGEILDEDLVIEEEMLESENGDQNHQEVTKKSGLSAGDATGKQIKTDDVFPDNHDAMFVDEADENITYAPEIISVEIPPDQMSQCSLNLVENIIELEALEKITDEPNEEENEENEEKGDNEFPEFPNDLYCGRSPRVSPFNRIQQPQAPQFIGNSFDEPSVSSLSSSITKQSSLWSALGVTSLQEMLLKVTSLDSLSEAMRMAGLGSSNLIFGIDYTASNKYQGERSFGGFSLHSLQYPSMENPYQQVIKVVSNTLAPFATDNGIPVFGFGDASTGDWSVFPLRGSKNEFCQDLEEVLKVYNEVTPHVDLSGPTNFAPLIYRSMEICQQKQEYHILVIIADGQVTNERATRKAIVNACQYPLSIIVVGVGDGPWEMMKIFDESLPKRPWDNFHFIEFNEIIKGKTKQDAELAFATHTLLEIPDQYQYVRRMGLLGCRNRVLAHYSPRSRSPRSPRLNKDNDDY